MIITYIGLLVIGGVFWSLTYLISIRRGFVDRTYSMPMAALAANVSWEATFSFIFPQFYPQLYIDYVWFLLDLVIVYQFLKFGKSEFPDFSYKQLYGVFSMAVVAAISAIMLITFALQDWIGAYSAFGQNLMMSVLFIAMFLRRSTLRGQSIYIAIFKMIGTGVTMVSYYLYLPAMEGSILLSFLFISIFVFDGIYVGLVYQKSRSEKIPVFHRI